MKTNNRKVRLIIIHYSKFGISLKWGAVPAVSNYAPIFLKRQRCTCKVGDNCLNAHHLNNIAAFQLNIITDLLAYHLASPTYQVHLCLIIKMKYKSCVLFCDGRPFSL